MATSPRAREGQRIVIDLSLDSDDSDTPPQSRSPQNQPQHHHHQGLASANTPPMDNQALFGTPPPWNFGTPAAIEEHALAGALRDADVVNANPAEMKPSQNHHRNGETIVIDGEEVFIPDESYEPLLAGRDQAQNAANHDFAVAAAVAEAEDFNVDTCLQRTLAIFPDISHDHVHALYNNYDESIPGPNRLEQIIDKLVSGESYPKQDKGKQKKRKREGEDEDAAEEKRWAAVTRDIRPQKTISAMLKAEFPEMPIRIITEELYQRKHLYHAYVAIAEAKDSREGSKPFRGRASKALADAETIAVNSEFPILSEELNAARKKVAGIRSQRAEVEAKKKAEHENLQQAMAAGELAECQACFDELPMNRQIHCDGDAPHFTCFNCLTTYIQSQIGEARCDVLCTAGCGAAFAYAQIQRLEDKALIRKLEQLQQEKAIRDAGIDGLEECPFCDWKAVLDPIEVDFIFRCQNPECEKVSCRRCKAISHVPISCEEHAKDHKLNSRHKIEEAMTAAMIRSCNSCKKQFIKDYGCNKMTCSSCGKTQCYVCSESVTNYDHFDQGPGRQAQAQTAGKCPLYDNVEERHEREVKEAETAARRQVLEDNPDVAEGDLEIKVSDAVKKATQDRIRRALPHGLGGAEDDDGNDSDSDDEEEGEAEALNLDHPARRLARQVRHLDAQQRGALRHLDAQQRRALLDRLGERLRLPNFPQPQHPAHAPHAQPPHLPVHVQGYIPVLGFGNANGLPGPAPPQQQQPVAGGRNLGEPLRFHRPEYGEFAGFYNVGPALHQPHPAAVLNYPVAQQPVQHPIQQLPIQQLPIQQHELIQQALQQQEAQLRVRQQHLQEQRRRLTLQLREQHAMAVQALPDLDFEGDFAGYLHAPWHDGRHN